MRGTVPATDLRYDPEIERTARKNNSKTRREKRQARQAQQEGTSTFSPSLTTVLEEETMAGNGNNQDVPEGNQSVMPCWTLSTSRKGKREASRIKVQNYTTCFKSSFCRARS